MASPSHSNSTGCVCSMASGGHEAQGSQLDRLSLYLKKVPSPSVIPQATQAHISSINSENLVGLPEVSMVTGPLELSLLNHPGSLVIRGIAGFAVHTGSMTVNSCVLLAELCSPGCCHDLPCPLESRAKRSLCFSLCLIPAVWCEALSALHAGPHRWCWN